MVRVFSWALWWGGWSGRGAAMLAAASFVLIAASPPPAHRAAAAKPRVMRVSQPPAEQQRAAAHHPRPPLSQRIVMGRAAKPLPPAAAQPRPKYAILTATKSLRLRPARQSKAASLTHVLPPVSVVPTAPDIVADAPPPALELMTAARLVPKAPPPRVAVLPLNRTLSAVSVDAPAEAPAASATIGAKTSVPAPATAQHVLPTGKTPANAVAGPRVVVLPPEAKFSFGPIEGVNFSSLSTATVFLNPNQTREPGSLQVDCEIGLDGVPTNCRKIAQDHGSDVSASILAWLGSGAIRYIPATKDGHMIVERRKLTIKFGTK